MMRKSGKLHFVLPITAVYCIWGIGALILVLQILNVTGGRFIYSLDDAYIHMAMAKHFAFNGVWGVTPFAFSSSSSSILWTLLLAGTFRVSMVHEVVPLVFSLLAAIGLIGIIYWDWMQRNHSVKWVVGLLVSWIVFIPMWPVLFNGMETMLQLLLTVGLGIAGVRYLTQISRKYFILLLVLSFLAAATRYESCYMIFVICLLVAIRGRWRESIVIGLVALTPIILYGLFSTSQGWLFFPNSILLKRTPVDFSNISSIWGMVIRPFQGVVDREVLRLPLWQSIAFILLLLILIRVRNKDIQTIWSDRILPAILFLSVACLHSFLVVNDWFFRYQMYLNILGIWAIGCVGVPSIDWRNAKKHIGSVFFGSLVAIILLLPILDYSIRATVETPIASANIWAQQYQMGIFLEEYYPDGKIAANDIGAINFLNSQHLVDLYGLATMRVLQEKWSGNWSRNLPDVLNSITKDEGAQIAVIYNSWFGYQSATGNASLPGSWIRVADWTIPNNVVCGGPTVTWYALRMEEVEKLRLSLSDFKPRLPPSVIVREYYSLP